MHALTDPTRWRAQLRLRFSRRADETILSAREHLGPLRVQRPFYPEARRRCHVYVLHPPGGLVSGDELGIDVQVEQDAWALLTTPGAGKYYRSDGHRSVAQQQHLHVDTGAVLEWLPQENILFDGARADVLTQVELQGDAKFLGWEISCLGRPASGERLRHCALRQRFELWREHQPIWLERSRYEQNSALFDAAWGLRGASVVGTLVCTNRDPAAADAVRDAVSIDPDEWFGVTQLDEVLVCRYLGHQGLRARARFIQAWEILRPLCLGAEAVAPRIWNT